MRAIKAMLAVLIVAVAVVALTRPGNLWGSADAVAAMVRGTPARSVTIARDGAGEFRVETRVNGQRLPMVIDTGATAVILSYEAAKAAGLPLELLAFTVDLDTVNGRARAAAVTLDRIAIGRLDEHAIPALVTMPGQLRTSLLGMSFLNRLESFELAADRITLRGYP